jgi:hypothetical protein
MQSSRPAGMSSSRMVYGTYSRIPAEIAEADGGVDAFGYHR